MTQRLQVAVIGTGNFGAYRRNSLRETGLYDIKALYDWNPEATAIAAHEDGARACSTLEEALDHPGLEAVVICTGAKFHAEQALAAMERGLHVFIEKPLCASEAELAALLEAQRRTGCVVGVGHKDMLTAPPAQMVKRMVQEGELGNLVAFEMTTGHSGGLLIQPGDWRGDADKNPGGMLFQCGVHSLHELMFLFGPPAEVSAMMRFNVHTTATADAALCQLRWANGLIGNLNAYHVIAYRHSLTLYGTQATLFREEDPYIPPGAHFWRQDTRLEAGLQPRVEIPQEGEGDDYGNVRAFYHAIREGAAMSPSLMDGARAVALVFAAEEAARAGRAVNLVERFPTLFEKK